MSIEKGEKIELIRDDWFIMKKLCNNNSEYNYVFPLK